MTYRERLLAWESEFGRTAGWDVELDGRKIVFLDDPIWEDMFWFSYRATAVDPVAVGRIRESVFWYEGDSERFVYRSRATGTVAALAYPGPIDALGRVSMRALYVDPGIRLPWDFAALYVRKMLRHRRRGSASED